MVDFIKTCLEKISNYDVVFCCHLNRCDQLDNVTFIVHPIDENKTNEKSISSGAINLVGKYLDREIKIQQNYTERAKETRNRMGKIIQLTKTTPPIKI